jgi:ferredoxin
MATTEEHGFINKLISEIFVARYFIDFFRRPRVHVTTNEYYYLLWSRLVEVPIIFLLWLLSRIPIIGQRMERTLAYKSSKFWRFKPVPMIDTLSDSAKKYKQTQEIEINKGIEVQNSIMDIVTLKELVKKLPFTYISNCGCRALIKNCDAPQPVCLTMRWVKDVSKELPDSSEYQLCNPKELEEVVDLCDKWALVHMTLNYPNENHPYHVCGCCDCCCIGFREFVTHAVPWMTKSKYIAKIDPEKCKGCYHCINYRCRFRAILKVNEDGTVIDTRKEDEERFKLKWPQWAEDKKGWGNQIRKDPPSWEKIKEEHSGKWYSQVVPKRCFGCGLCASSKYGCPEGAIKLYPR